LPRSSVKSIRRACASMRLSCPPMTLALGRAGDLDPAVEQRGHGLGHPPRRVGPDVGGLRAEVRELAGGEAGPPGAARVEQGDPPGGEAVVERDQEVQRPGGEDLVEPLVQSADDVVPHANCSVSVEPRSAVVSPAGLSTVLTRSK
jgi:hypothetical protein